MSHKEEKQAVLRNKFNKGEFLDRWTSWYLSFYAKEQVDDGENTPRHFLLLLGQAISPFLSGSSQTSLGRWADCSLTIFLFYYSEYFSK